MIHTVILWTQTFFQFRTLFLKRLIQNLTRCKFVFQNLPHRSIPILKWNNPKRHEKRKKLRFHGVTYFKTWIFDCKLYLIFWHVLKFSFQNLKCCTGFIQILTHCIAFRQKLCLFVDFVILFWGIVKISAENPGFRKSRQNAKICRCHSNIFQNVIFRLLIVFSIAELFWFF